MHILENYEVWTKNYQQRISEEEYVINICEDYLPLLGNVEHMPNVKVVKMTVDGQVKDIEAVPNHPGFRKFKKNLPKDERKQLEKEK